LCSFLFREHLLNYFLVCSKNFYFYKQPTANSQQPTANSQQPTANSQQPTTIF
jgi:hypothetical protein